jgi:hypothetical protein
MHVMDVIIGKIHLLSSIVFLRANREMQMIALFQKIGAILKVDVSSTRLMKMRGTFLVARKRDGSLSG